MVYMYHDVNHFKKVFFDFVMISPLIYVFAFQPRGMWDLSVPNRALCLHWKAKFHRLDRQGGPH